MKERIRSKQAPKYLMLMISFLLVVMITLGYLLVRQAEKSMTTLLQTRMLDISNTAAAMIDGDVMETVTPEDKGTEGYESIMRTLTYFQDNIDLKYIYCIRDEGNGKFTFGLDPTVEDPGEFGSPIVYTEALGKASKGIASADNTYYEDSWGKFYSAYSPVFDSKGNVAGIIAVDFSAEWYDEQLATLTRTTLIVAFLSLLIGAAIVVTIVTRNEQKIGSIHSQLNELSNTLMQEMGNDPEDTEAGQKEADPKEEPASIESLGAHIQSMQTELKTQISQVHGHAYQDGLTGVKSKQSYLEMEKALNEKMAKGALPDFGIVVCDVNDLKRINDTLGHQAGDEYIRKACRMICDIFGHSPVYRIGGDEFVVILTGRDYENRKMLMYELHRRSAAHIADGDAVVSGGLGDYVPKQDQSVHEVFERADSAMYEEKTLLKTLGEVRRGEGQDLFDREDISYTLPMINIRKHILIADDVASNREILGDLLRDDYDIYYAADGRETMEVLRDHKDEIALVLLDLYMPRMTGREVIAEMQVDKDLVSIPVIVLTIDQDAELDSLKTGAMDFIPKPYPDAEIVKTRIAKCIELSETRDLIRHTEKDPLTGLFNINYFIRYVNRFDQQFKDIVYDAVVCQVSRSDDTDEDYGKSFGDLMARRIGMSMKMLARKTGGIGCRQGDSTFLLYCQHQDDYRQLFQKVIDEVNADPETRDNVRLRFGVFVNAKQEENIEERFACAKAAAESIANEEKTFCGYYEYIGS